MISKPHSTVTEFNVILEMICYPLVRTYRHDKYLYSIRFITHHHQPWGYSAEQYCSGQRITVASLHQQQPTK